MKKDVVQLLLASGADPTIQIGQLGGSLNKGLGPIDTALSEATQRGHNKMVGILEAAEKKTNQSKRLGTRSCYATCLKFRRSKMNGPSWRFKFAIPFLMDSFKRLIFLFSPSCCDLPLLGSAEVRPIEVRLSRYQNNFLSTKIVPSQLRFRCTPRQ